VLSAFSVTEPHEQASAQAGSEPAMSEPAGNDPAEGDLSVDLAGGPYRAKGDVSWSIDQADAVSWLKTVGDGSVDLLVTDPPYESLEKHRAVGTTTRLKHSKSSSNDWFTVFPNARFRELFDEVYRVLKKDAHFYLFCDQETAFVAKPIGEEAGFKFWKPLIWDKQKIGMGYHYRSRYEMILFFEKGKRKLADLGIADVIRENRIYRGYPTEKPVKVNQILIEQSSSPGEIVVDPFMGTASAGLAALSTGRSFWGCDVSDKAIAIATERLSATGAERRERPKLVPGTEPEGQLALRLR
jgi:site-specific DNA-methyltransferase (adenine-specific)